MAFLESIAYKTWIHYFDVYLKTNNQSFCQFQSLQATKLDSLTNGLQITGCCLLKQTATMWL